jgi:hypothetical protein
LDSDAETMREIFATVLSGKAGRRRRASSLDIPAVVLLARALRNTADHR